MKLFVFYFLLTLLYITGAGYLFHELRTSSKEQRRALQTVPLLLGATAFYVTVLHKTHQLIQYFVGA